MSEVAGGPERIPDGQVFSEVQLLIDNWNFERADPSESAHFAFNLSHWLVETYGDEYNKEYWRMSTVYEGVNGLEVPSPLRRSLMHSYMDKIVYTNGNYLNLKTQTVDVVGDPYVPKWDELEGLPFIEMREKALNDPEIRDNVVPTHVGVFPEVSVSFQTERILSKSWGIEFVTNQNGVRMAVFGDQGGTWPAMEFATENSKDQSLLNELVCRLALLAARNESNRLDPRNGLRRARPVSDLETLYERLAGEQTVPVLPGGHYGKPENGRKDMIISAILKARETPEP